MYGVTPSQPTLADESREPERGRKLLRRMAGIGQAATLGFRSYSVDAVLRPVSTTSLYSSLVGKSAFGFARRVALDAVELPILVNNPG